MSDVQLSGGGAAAAGDSRKKLLVVGAGVVVLLLLGLFVIKPMLFGGDSSDEFDTVVRPRSRAAAPAKAKAKAAVKPAAKKPQPVPVTFNDSVGRDPFRKLYVEPVAAGAAAPGDPAAPAPAAPAPATGGYAAAPTSSGQVGGVRVALVDVFARDGKTYAQTKVSSTVYTPAVGQVFANNYKVLAVSGSCATYLYGDEQFQLCEGQEVLK